MTQCPESGRKLVSRDEERLKTLEPLVLAPGGQGKHRRQKDPDRRPSVLVTELQTGWTKPWSDWADWMEVVQPETQL
jgi:hypothetical protein